MKIEYKIFAHQFLITRDKVAAYKAAYPKAQGEALKTAARRLMRNPHVQQYIEEQLQQLTGQAIATQQQEQQQVHKAEEATLALKRKVLLQMINGEHKVTRHYKMRNHLQEVESPLSPFALLRAIELDTKLAKDWYSKNKKEPEPPPVEQKDKSGYSLPLPPLREGHRIPLGLQAKELWEIGLEAFCEKHYGPDYMPGLRAQHLVLNPHRAKDYKEQGLRVLDYVPTNEELELMKGCPPRRDVTYDIDISSTGPNTPSQRFKSDGGLVPPLPPPWPPEKINAQLEADYAVLSKTPGSIFYKPSKAEQNDTKQNNMQHGVPE